MRENPDSIHNRLAPGVSGLTPPVLFLIFNRPETTRSVMRSISKASPTQLFVAADGPRSGRAGEAEQCEAARREATAVAWDCDLHTLFRDQNLGCGVAVSEAITWFFEQVPEGLILEDDCIPAPSFFRFGAELLQHYRDVERVMHISGSNLQYGRRRGSASYYFSRLPNIWGWGTWRRAWRHYDFGLRPDWELDDTWDTQWQLSIAKADGLSIVPNVNLVTNIGMGPGGTHTKGNERAANLKAFEMSFPLEHPRQLKANKVADVFTYYAHYRQVKHLNLILMYQVRDNVHGILKALKRWLVGPRPDKLPGTGNS